MIDPYLQQIQLNTCSKKMTEVAKVHPSRIWGDKCPKSDIVINQGPTSLPSGIPTYTVEIVNTCTTASHMITCVLLMFIFH
ncbi:hypothetical protein L6452_00016 [Arctium lappa]|uniref:Uncharacterized protein n=1 Tax=Arctium lappa TaxID=4217 RepID=A0ACB9FDH0_ARCLA|nr:hypothetical protein L6452_00016 [Arctium lappa]